MHSFHHSTCLWVLHGGRYPLNAIALKQFNKLPLNSAPWSQMHRSGRGYRFSHHWSMIRVASALSPFSMAAISSSLVLVSIIVKARHFFGPKGPMLPTATSAHGRASTVFVGACRTCYGPPWSEHTPCNSVPNWARPPSFQAKSRRGAWIRA